MSHFEGILGPLLDQLGAILGYLRPSWAILGASWCQELPRYLPDGYACAPAPPSWPILLPILGPKICIFWVFFGIVFWITFWSLFGQLLGKFWGPFWDQIGPRRGQDGPKRAIKSFKEPKLLHLQTTLKNNRFFKVFGVQRPPKRALGSPRRLPRGTQRAPKPPKKGIQKCTPKVTIFGPILGRYWGSFWGPKLLQKGTKNGTQIFSGYRSHSCRTAVAANWASMAITKSTCRWGIAAARSSRECSSQEVQQLRHLFSRPLSPSLQGVPAS